MARNRDALRQHRLPDRIEDGVGDLGWRASRINDHCAEALVPRSHPRVPPQRRSELFRILAEGVGRASRQPVAERVVIDHQTHGKVKQIAHVRLVLGRSAEECDSGAGLVRELLHPPADDDPPEAIEPADRSRVWRVVHDLASLPVNPLADSIVVSVTRDRATAMQQLADRRLARSRDAGNPHQRHAARLEHERHYDPTTVFSCRRPGTRATTRAIRTLTTERHLKRS